MEEEEEEEEEEGYSATMNNSSLMTDLRRTALLDTTKPTKVKPDVPEQRAFIVSDRHSTIKAARLSIMWEISKKQAHKTLRVTTQRGVQSAVMPLSRRYKSYIQYTKVVRTLVYGIYGHHDVEH